MARLAQYGFSGGTISPQCFGRTDLEKYALSLRRAKNCIISKPGSVMNRPGTEFVGEVRDSSKSTRLVPFSFNTVQNYVLELGDEVMRPIMDGGQVLRTAVNITGISVASTAVITAVAHGASAGERVFITAVTGVTVSGISLVNNRSFIVLTTPTADTMTVSDLFGTTLDTSAAAAWSSGGTVSRLYQLTLPYDHLEVFDIGYGQSADIMNLAHLSYAPRKLTRSGHAAWTIDTITFGPVQAAPTNPAAAATVASGATVNYYKITAIDEDAGEESLPTSAVNATNDLTVSGNYNTITWTAASGAERYIVYKADNGVYGLIGGTTGTSFIDENILPDLGDTPPAARNPFSSSNNYPARTGFHEGRSVWACTNNTPGGVWLSCSNLYYNLNVASPAKSDDAVSFDLRPGVNAVKGLASTKRLVVLTADAEYTVEGGGVTKYITPASLVVERHTARGSNRLQPITIGDIVLHTQRQGAVVRAFGYSFEKDGYRTNDLTLLAPHLFRGHTIVDWCYQQDPDSVVWCVRDDGVLLALTFVEDQNTFAWTDCYLGGTFGSGASATGFGVVESVACIEGDEQDDVYLVVKRTVNSVTKRYIERLAPRWNATFDTSDEITNVEDMYFLDCGVIEASVTGLVVSGLWHLEGQSVYALGDGDIQGPFTVASGQITLTTAATTVHVGLSYVGDVVDLPITQQTQNGAAQGRVKGTNALVLKLHQTRGIKLGGMLTDDDKLVELKTRDGETTWDDPIQPYSGDIRPVAISATWSLDGSVRIVSGIGLPMEITMIAKDVTIGGP